MPGVNGRKVDEELLARARALGPPVCDVLHDPATIAWMVTPGAAFPGSLRGGERREQGGEEDDAIPLG